MAPASPSKILLRLAVLVFGMPLFALSLGAQTKAPSAGAKQEPSDAIQHVSVNGSDSADGLSWGSAKATLRAARTALPRFGGEILTGPDVQNGTLSSTGLLNFTNLTGRTFDMHVRRQWFLRNEERTLEGNPTILGTPAPYHYPAVIGKKLLFDTAKTTGDLLNVQEIMGLTNAVQSFSPSFAGTIWGEELDADLTANTTIDHVVGLGVYVGPYASNGSTKNMSTAVSGTCENNGSGFLATCRSFVAGAEVNGTAGSTWGGWAGFWAVGPGSRTAPNNEGTFRGNIYNFYSTIPKTLPTFSSSAYHYFGMYFYPSSDPWTNDVWFAGGKWNSGHFVFGSGSDVNRADHVWWAGGKYGWETKEGGAPTSPTDFTYSTAMIDSRTNTLVMPRGRVSDPAITAEGPLTLDPKQLNLSPRGHGIVISDNSHLQQSNANGDLAGRITLTSGVGHRTFAHAFTNPPVCVATDTTAANAVRVTTSTISLTVTGTRGDVVNYICIGNPN